MFVIEKKKMQDLYDTLFTCQGVDRREIGEIGENASTLLESFASFTKQFRNLCSCSTFFCCFSQN